MSAPNPLAVVEESQGIFRIGTHWVNLYAIRDGDQLTLIDSGYRGYFSALAAVLEKIGPGLSGVAAVLVTHHHVDHIGTAEQIRKASGAAVYVGAKDLAKTNGDQASRPPHGFYSLGWRPTMIRYLAHTIRYGGAGQAPVTSPCVVDGAETLDVPGHPRVVPTPGHTHGHYSVVLDDRGVVFTGDALVNFDYATAETGVKVHRLNEDRERAFSSLDALEQLNSERLLFGHGEPFFGSALRAVNAARHRFEQGP